MRPDDAVLLQAQAQTHLLAAEASEDPSVAAEHVDAAIGIGRELVRSTRASDALHLDLGRAYEARAGLASGADAQRDRDRAEEQYEAALAYVPDHVTALEGLARLAIADVPGLQSVFTMVGNGRQAGFGGVGAGEVRRASLTLNLKPRGERPKQQVIENQIRARLQTIPGARFTVGQGGFGEKINLIIASDDGNALKATSQALERQLRGVGSLSNISSTASPRSRCNVASSSGAAFSRTVVSSFPKRWVKDLWTSASSADIAVFAFCSPFATPL